MDKKASELTVGLPDNQQPALRIDQKTLDEARLQNSPAKRMTHFEKFFADVTDEMVPTEKRYNRPLSEYKKTLLELDGVKAAYRQLYGRDMVEDVPVIEKQFEMLKDKYKNGMIPEDDMIVVLGMASRFASDDKDSPQIPSKVK